MISDASDSQIPRSIATFQTTAKTDHTGSGLELSNAGHDVYCYMSKNEIQRISYGVKAALTKHV